MFCRAGAFSAVFLRASYSAVLHGGFLRFFSAAYFFSQRTVFCVAEVFKKCYSLKSSPHPFFAVGDVVLQEGGLPRAAPPPAAKKKEPPPVFFKNFFFESSVSFFFFGNRAPARLPRRRAAGRPLAKPSPQRKASTVTKTKIRHRKKTKKPPFQFDFLKNHHPNFAAAFSGKFQKPTKPPRTPFAQKKESSGRF